MNYLTVGDTIYTISSRERVWWRNLRGGADVTLRLRGKDVPAWAEAIEDLTEVARELFLYLKAAPKLARYMNVTIDSYGIPNSDDVERLAYESVVICTRPK